MSHKTHRYQHEAERLYRALVPTLLIERHIWPSAKPQILATILAAMDRVLAAEEAR